MYCTKDEEKNKFIIDKFQDGMIVEGKVKNIKPYGAFIELKNGITGFLRIDDISISRIKNPSERINIGQNIKVMIKSINKAENKIDLTCKELFGNWEENIKDIQEKTIIKGIIKEPDKLKNGIFVELKPNLVGMAEYKEGYKYGEVVDVFVKKIIKDKKKIKLNIIK